MGCKTPRPREDNDTPVLVPRGPYTLEGGLRQQLTFLTAPEITDARGIRDCHVLDQQGPGARRGIRQCPGSSPPPRPSPHMQKPPSPGVTAHGHAAAAVGVPGTVGVPSEHTVGTGAVLHAVGWGQLYQLGAGAREEQLLPEKHRTETEPGPGTARAGARMAARAPGRSRKRAVLTSQSGKSEGWQARRTYYKPGAILSPLQL